jgi:hypothetical protein
MTTTVLIWEGGGYQLNQKKPAEAGTYLLFDEAPELLILVRRIGFAMDLKDCNGRAHSAGQRQQGKGDASHGRLWTRVQLDGTTKLERRA